MDLFSGLGTAVIGGILGRRKGPSIEAQIMSQARGARAAADAFGFNPLTMLGVSQGYQVPQHDTGLLSAGAWLGQAIDRGLDTVFSGDNGGAQAAANQARAANKARDDYNQVLSRDVTRRFGYGLTDQQPFGADISVTPAPALSAPSRHPDAVKLRTEHGPQPLVNVRHAVTGKWLAMDPGVAARLGLKSGDTMLAEDDEAIFGDIGGEIQSLAAMGDGVFSSNVGMGAYRNADMGAKPPAIPPRSPKKKLPKRWAPNQRP